MMPGKSVAEMLGFVSVSDLLEVIYDARGEGSGVGASRAAELSDQYGAEQKHLKQYALVMSELQKDKKIECKQELSKS